MVATRAFAAIFTASLLATSSLTPAQAGDADSWASLSGVGIGGGVFVMPKYEGSSHYRVLGAPIVSPPPSADGSDGFIAVRGIDDIRIRLFQRDGFEFGPVVGWRFDREESDGRRLAGLGDVDGGLVLGGYVAYNIGIFKPFLAYNHQVTGDDTGGALRIGTDVKLVSTKRFEFTGTIGTTYADDHYMRSYFGVSAAQSAASLAGMPIYDASSGFKDVFIGATAKLELSERWTLHMAAQYARLVGDADDSPLVESSNQWTAGLGATYRFDWR